MPSAFRARRCGTHDLRLSSGRLPIPVVIRRMVAMTATDRSEASAPVGEDDRRQHNRGNHQPHRFAGGIVEPPPRTAHLRPGPSHDRMIQTPGAGCHASARRGGRRHVPRRAKGIYENLPGNGVGRHQADSAILVGMLPSRFCGPGLLQLLGRRGLAGALVMFLMECLDLCQLLRRQHGHDFFAEVLLHRPHFLLGAGQLSLLRVREIYCRGGGLSYVLARLAGLCPLRNL